MTDTWTTTRDGGEDRTALAEMLAVETRGVSKSFGARRILDNVDLTIPEGSLSAIMGPSGTGKSVLLKHVVGLIKPDAGDVLVRGRSLGGMSRSEILALRRDIGVMFQDGALFSSMTLYDNVAFPLRQHSDLDEGEVHALVHEQLAAVGLVAAKDRLPNQLSGGMRKRAGLARALVLNPGIIVCDEPDSGLDPVRTAVLGELLMERHAALGGTMIVVTHDVMLARLISDYVAILWRGRVVEHGDAKRVWQSEDPFVRQFLHGEANGPLDMGE